MEAEAAAWVHHGAFSFYGTFGVVEGTTNDAWSVVGEGAHVEAKIEVGEILVVGTIVGTSARPRCRSRRARSSMAVRSWRAPSAPTSARAHERPAGLVALGTAKTDADQVRLAGPSGTRRLSVLRRSDALRVHQDGGGASALWQGGDDPPRALSRAREAKLRLRLIAS
jgi:hypothetical protein